MKGVFFVFSLLFTLFYARYECSMEGYEEYLALYSMKCGNDCDEYKKWLQVECVT